jgi:hypothetical protein
VVPAALEHSNRWSTTKSVLLIQVCLNGLLLDVCCYHRRCNTGIGVGALEALDLRAEISCEPLGDRAGISKFH